MGYQNMQKSFSDFLRGEGISLAAKFYGIKFKEAKTKEEKEMAYRVRYEVYREKGYIEEDPKKVFADKYDQGSLNFVATKGGEPVGTVRLVLNSAISFPTEDLFNFDPPEVGREKIGEISRLAIRKDFRGGKKIVVMGLIWCIYEYSKKHSLEYLYINVPDKLAEHFKKFGITITPLEEKEPTGKHLEERAIIGGYFAQKRLKPYIIDVAQNEDKLGLK